MELIIYISIFLWFLPLYKQYKGSFIYYFIINALLDPINYLLVINKFNFFEEVRIIALFLIFITLRKRQLEFIYKDKLNLFLFLIVAILYLILPLSNYVSFTLKLLIFGKISSFIINDYFNKNTLNIFYIVLITYEVLTLLNPILALAGTTLSISYYKMTAVFMYIFPLFFTFVKSTDKFVIRKLS